jgi:hypothetical protein
VGNFAESPFISEKTLAKSFVSAKAETFQDGAEPVAGGQVGTPSKGVLRNGSGPTFGFLRTWTKRGHEGCYQWTISPMRPANASDRFPEASGRFTLAFLSPPCFLFFNAMNHSEPYDDSGAPRSLDPYPAPLRVLISHMERNGLVHQVEPENLAVTFRIRGRSGGAFRCLGFLNDSLDLLQFMVVYPDQVPQRRRRAMAQAVTLANFGMKLGFFELNMEDGELRVHTASAFEPGSLPSSVVNWCISTGIAIADRYYASIQAISWGSREPADAIFEAEHPEASLLYEDEPFDEEDRDSEDGLDQSRREAQDP